MAQYTAASAILMYLDRRYLTDKSKGASWRVPSRVRVRMHSPDICFTKYLVLIECNLRRGLWPSPCRAQKLGYPFDHQYFELRGYFDASPRMVRQAPFIAASFPMHARY